MPDLNSFIKTIDIKFDIDSDDVQDIHNILEGLQDDARFDLSEIDEDKIKSVRDLMKKLQNQTLQWDGTGGLFGAIDQAGMKGVREYATNKFTDKLKSIGADFIDKTKQVFSDAWNELSNILSYSQLTDSSVREQAFTYGFNPAENYAFSKSLDFMGLSGIDDMFYMNQQQREKFLGLFTKYQEKYSSLYDSGFFDTMQDFKWEMQEFKEDFVYSIADFMMENKDVIKTVLQCVIDVSEWILTVFASFINSITGNNKRTESDKAAMRAAIFGTNNTTTTNNNMNMKFDNTFNITESTNQEALSHSGAMTYESIIRALVAQGVQ